MTILDDILARLGRGHWLPSGLHDAGLSAREVGSLVGVSYQRVQQLLAEGAGKQARSGDRG